jgi:phospholipase/carboxylesterase
MSATLDMWDLPVIVDIGTNPTASVIWLHGLGADGHDFEPIVPQLQLPEGLELRFVFPHAPPRAITWNNGLVMRAWYDMYMTEKGFVQNLEHLRESENAVHGLIAQEMALGIAPERIVLAGFSQGAGVALHAGLHFKEKIAGILCLSSAMPGFESLIADMTLENVNTPIFLAHGDQDAVVPFAIGENAHKRLKSAGLTVEWHRYSMGHSVSGEEIIDISRWLARVLAP